MADMLGKLAKGPRASRRRALLLTAALSSLVLLYCVFEFGRYDAGFRIVDSMRGALAAGARIRDLETENERQKQLLAAADVSRQVDREGYTQVERSLGDMQSQIDRLTQDLSFYRGLVQPDSLVHVKVQQMQILPEAAPGQYRLKFVLIQTGKPESIVAGSTVISLDGLLRGKPASMNFAQVSPNHRASVAYSFRYFEDYDEPVRLPAGFEPARVGVDIYSSRDPGHGFRQAFVWKAQGISPETETGEGSKPANPGGVRTDTE